MNEVTLAVNRNGIATAENNPDREQIELVKQTVARGCSDTELQLFLYTAKRTGLDPLLRQIHAIKRWDSTLNREAMAIQTGIDGYRLVADRTGKYAPGERPTFTYKQDGSLVSAVAYVKKQTPDGQWHVVEAEAFWDEYVQKKKDGQPNIMWATKGRGMLAKCAEALALRKAFPAELSGLYTHEEMMQADNETDKPKPAQGSIRDRVIGQVMLAQDSPNAAKVLRQVVVDNAPATLGKVHTPKTPQAETLECTTTPTVEGAGPVPASAPTPPAEVAVDGEGNRLKSMAELGWMPPADEKPWQKGIVTAITQNEKLTRAKKPWGTITLETIEGSTVEATWFGFSHPWSYETIKEQLCGTLLDVEYVLTPANDPKYKPTLEHIRVPQ